MELDIVHLGPSEKCSSLPIHLPEEDRQMAQIATSYINRVSGYSALHRCLACGPLRSRLFVAPSEQKGRGWFRAALQYNDGSPCLSQSLFVRTKAPPWVDLGQPAGKRHHPLAQPPSMVSNGVNKTMCQEMSTAANMTYKGIMEGPQRKGP